VSDETLTARIERLVAEEHELRKREESDKVEDREADAGRLASIEVELDVCWDLLRQRKALRDTGRDPDQAQPRDPSVVERYLQ
jgi:hypothetical protein